MNVAVTFPLTHLPSFDCMLAASWANRSRVGKTFLQGAASWWFATVMGGKRASTGSGGGKSKALKSSTVKATSDSETLPHVKRVIDWLTDCNNLPCICIFFCFIPVLWLCACRAFLVILAITRLRFQSIVVPQGGPDRYLMNKYKTEERPAFCELWVIHYCFPFPGGDAGFCSVAGLHFPSKQQACLDSFDFPCVKSFFKNLGTRSVQGHLQWGHAARRQNFARLAFGLPHGFWPSWVLRPIWHVHPDWASACWGVACLQMDDCVSQKFKYFKFDWVTNGHSGLLQVWLGYEWSLRFRTNPDDPGTEKLSIWPPTDAWLESKYVTLPFLDEAGEGLGSRKLQEFLLFEYLGAKIGFVLIPWSHLSGCYAIPPFSVAYVKGWRRALACLISCEAVRALGLDVSELTPKFKAGLRPCASQIV